MQRPLSAWLTGTALALGACSTSPASVAPTVGIDGAPLSGTLEVVVVDDETRDPIEGALVAIGETRATTDATGRASLAAPSGSVTLDVSRAGYVTEHWMNVDRTRAVVALAAPLDARALAGTITGGSADTIVSAATTLSILRVTSLGATTSACPGGACGVSVTVELETPRLDLVLVEGSTAHLATGLPITGETFSVDLAALTATERLVTLDVTLPEAPGLQAVVGVPGIATSAGVAVLPSSPTGASLLAPAREGPMEGARLWYVARAVSTDGSGETIVFDREVGADLHVVLPSSFLAIPSATAEGTIGIDVDPEVDLYVVEAYAGASVDRTLVLHPSGTHLDLPIDLAGASGVAVRAIDADGAIAEGAIDLDAVEARATRIATLRF